MINLQTELAGNYSCHTENVFGRDQVIYQVIVTTVPDPPVLVVLGSTQNSLALQWRVISDGGSHITGNQNTSLLFLLKYLLH